MQVQEEKQIWKAIATLRRGQHPSTVQKLKRKIMDNKKFSKVTISARIDADKAEAIRTLATEKGMLISEVVTEIVNYYFMQPEQPAPAEPAQQKECIVLTDMQLVTVAAIMECSDILKLSYPQTIDKLMDKIIEQTGAVTPTYMGKAKELFNKNM